MTCCVKTGEERRTDALTHVHTHTQVVCTAPLATGVIFQTTPGTQGMFSLLSSCTVMLLDIKSPFTWCHSAPSHLPLSSLFTQQALHRVSHLWVTRAQETRLSRETPKQETETNYHSQEEEEVGVRYIPGCAPTYHVYLAAGQDTARPRLRDTNSIFSVFLIVTFVMVYHVICSNMVCLFHSHAVYPLFEPVSPSRTAMETKGHGVC